MSVQAESREPLLDIAGVADYLGTSERHIRRLVAERRIPHHKVGGLVRFRLETVDQWLAHNERCTSAPISHAASVTSITRRRSAQTAPKSPGRTKRHLGD